MRIAVTERLVWDIPDGSDLEKVRETYQRTYEDKLGEPLVVRNGDTWTLVRVEDVLVQEV